MSMVWVEEEAHVGAGSGNRCVEERRGEDWLKGGQDWRSLRSGIQGRIRVVEV